MEKKLNINSLEQFLGKSYLQIGEDVFMFGDAFAVPFAGPAEHAELQGGARRRAASLRMAPGRAARPRPLDPLQYEG